MLCGQVCAGSPFDAELSLRILAHETEVPPVIRQLLERLAIEAREHLGSGEYAFQPLLPDDDIDLAGRLAALAEWCDGFIAGFAGAWVMDAAAMLPETREVLGDFARIAQVDQTDARSLAREEEVNFMEIVEYARMAAITVYQQNNASAAPPGPAHPADEPVH